MVDSLIIDKYEAVIGLEVHAQLLTHSKAFSNDEASYGESPNTLLSVITLGHPGTLPRLNKRVVEMAIKMGLACNCEIRKENQFARKNYFYPDLPKGYQITQHTTPICFNGFLELKNDSIRKRVGITRIHMEEDAGKSMHDQDPYFTLIDLNRAGTPLIEIVSEPDIRSGEEAYLYLTEIRKLLRYLDICDGNMEEGSMRCDANISVRIKGAEKFGTKVEVKNMNSIRNVKRAIEHEIIRQIELLETGKLIDTDTRSFNAADGTTTSMRSKEQANDYRYFPEPDLPPVSISDNELNRIKSLMPEMPDKLKDRLISQFGLSDYDAAQMVNDKSVSEYFLAVTSFTKNYKAIANWLMGPIKNYLNDQAISIKQFLLKPLTIAELIAMIDEGKTNFAVASQKIFPELILNPEKSSMEIAEELNLIQTTDANSIETIVDAVLQKFPEKVIEYKAGKTGLMGLFVGEVMKASKGKADPKITNQLIAKKLNA